MSESVQHDEQCSSLHAEGLSAFCLLNSKVGFDKIVVEHTVHRLD